jgi:ribosomal protein S18 acetylase RimI-like enzyme
VTAGPSIGDAASDTDFENARALFEEYQRALGVDLCFQNFSDELARIREIYGPPRGCLLLARHGASVAGCVGVRPLQGDACEMKRLYVRPQARAKGLGRRLALAIIDRARAAGYGRMVLDTLPSMREALALYESLGFREREAYYPNPLPGVVYLELPLSGAASA